MLSHTPSTGRPENLLSRLCLPLRVAACALSLAVFEDARSAHLNLACQNIEVLFAFSIHQAVPLNRLSESILCPQTEMWKGWEDLQDKRWRSIGLFGGWNVSIMYITDNVVTIPPPNDIIPGMAIIGYNMRIGDG